MSCFRIFRTPTSGAWQSVAATESATTTTPPPSSLRSSFFGIATTPSIQEPTQQQAILLDIVGVMGLTIFHRNVHNAQSLPWGIRMTKKISNATIDPYCVVYVDGKEVHRTKTLKDDENPIWDVMTQSLCVVHVPMTSVTTTEHTVNPTTTSTATPVAPAPADAAANTTTIGPLSRESNSTSMTTISPIGGEVTISVRSGTRCYGNVALTYDQLRKGTGERMEFDIPLPMEQEQATTTMTQSSDSSQNHARLALCFRPATTQDLSFLSQQGKIWRTSFGERQDNLAPSPSSSDTNYSYSTDINFRSIIRNPLFQGKQKNINGIQHIRVQPYPDPDHPKETEWMTPQDVEVEVMKPSKRWTSVGQGTLGVITLEILACDDLPDMDFNINDYTDAFVAIVLEDCVVRTDIIWDNLNPRWMPWSNRAFQFHVRHPTSILMLGVFDYDDAPVDFHDPIGRVLLNTTSFRPDTEYTLFYNLHHDPRQADRVSRGTIKIRLMIHWENESSAMKLCFTAPPQFLINVDNVKSHQIVRYVTRGAVNMEKPTVDTVKLYASELVSYGENIFYALDVLLEILLWRGRIDITKTRTIWFPIHSLYLFCSTVILVERPEWIAPIVLYAMAWFLLSLNYHASTHPYPWLRVQKSTEVNMTAFFKGGTNSLPQQIAAGEGLAEKEKLERLDQLKSKRMSMIVTAWLQFLLKAYRIYSKTTVTAAQFATEVREWDSWQFLSGRLYYLHMMLKYQCYYIRLFRNFINSKSFANDAFSTNCILLASVWLILPLNTALLWTTRILVWACLGPWMKLVDIYWVHSWYETKDELLQRIENNDDSDPKIPDFDILLESNWLMKMAITGRITSEQSCKRKAMRNLIYGSYCEAVPKVDSSRYPSVPLPQSFAKPANLLESGGTSLSGESRYHVPGQMLVGGYMIPNVATAREGTRAQNAKSSHQIKMTDESKKTK